MTVVEKNLVKTVTEESAGEGHTMAGAAAGRDAGAPSPGVPRVALAVLAAGASTRMGACKLALPFAGATLLGRALDAALACAADAAGPARAADAPGSACVSGPARAASLAAVDVFVVTGAHRASAAGIAGARGVRCLHNPSWSEGQSTSVALAAAAARATGADALLVMVADQPFIESRHLRALVGAFASVRAAEAAAAHTQGDPAASGPAACAAGPAPALPDAFVSCAGGRRGNPCLFAASCLDELLALTGDEGARQVLRSRAGAGVAAVDMGDDPLLFSDADTPEEFARLERLALERRGGERLAWECRTPGRLAPRRRDPLAPFTHVPKEPCA